MKISFVEIQNFRKLKACRIELANRETILVGANNSGKTSAMDALILFLKENRRSDISTTDFTLSNWLEINKIGLKWVEAKGVERFDLTLEEWLPYLPSLDIWLEVREADLHHVISIVPTLDWGPEQLLGIRFLFAPKDLEEFYKEFRNAYINSRQIEKTASSRDKPNLNLWPQNMHDFLEKELHKFFEIKFYILDPTKCCDPQNGIAKPQLLPNNIEAFKKDPIGSLLKIDIIYAQRGFSDPKTEEEYRGVSSLSSQLRKYFDKHLNPTDAPDVSDIEALQAIEEANSIFDGKLKNSFKTAIGELEGLNYPGFSDPRITLTSKINAMDSLDHKTAVQFNVMQDSNDGIVLVLPEQYNGLGYQNLISMVFRLIRFRDEWIRVGKANKLGVNDKIVIEPLHIVLIEEPEAHLHAQVQQVFIKKAYQVLRNNDRLKEDLFQTQMIVSTHSSYIAHELDFTCLRYFRRDPAKGKGEIPLATVVNLSKTFGDEDETSRFAKRYIRSTDCDLFFADAVILVEGSAERMLVPHFIKNYLPKLDKSYISILEIGGSHAHRLKPLLDTLAIISLIITDIESIDVSGQKKVFPELNKGYRTGNTTLKEWIPSQESLDKLLVCPSNGKQSTSKLIRVAYQCPIKLRYRTKANKEEAIPYTFEDAMALTNLELFRGYQNPKGLLKKLKESLNKSTLKEASEEMYNMINENGSNKASMALELLFLTEPKEIKPPTYIYDGLKWLESKLAELKRDFLIIEERGKKIARR